MAVTMQALFGTGSHAGARTRYGAAAPEARAACAARGWVVAKIVSGLVLAVLAYAPIVIVALAAGKLALDAAR
jgi:hypothetical protein